MLPRVHPPSYPTLSGMLSVLHVIGWDERRPWGSVREKGMGGGLLFSSWSSRVLRLIGESPPDYSALPERKG